MKKVLAIVLSVAMLACFAIPAFAADGVSFSVTAPEYAKAGDTIEVAVALGEGDFSSANFVLKYDQEKLSPKTVITKGGLGNLADAGTGNAKGEEGVLYGIAFAYPTSELRADAEDLVIFKAKFDVKADVADGDKLDFELTATGDVMLADGEGVNAPVAATFGKATTTVGEAPAPVDPSQPTDPTDPTDPVDPSKPADPSTAPSTTPSTVAPSTTAPSTNNPKTGDAGVAVFAGIVAAAAAAAFVVGKKKA